MMPLLNWRGEEGGGGNGWRPDPHYKGALTLGSIHHMSYIIINKMLSIKIIIEVAKPGGILH